MLKKEIPFLFLFCMLYGMQLGCQRRSVQEIYDAPSVQSDTNAQDGNHAVPVPARNLQFFPKR